MVDISALRGSSPTKTDDARATELALRRRFAGTTWDRPTGGPPTRSEGGEWMQRLVIDLPDAMRIALEDRAEARAVSVDQVIREALVVMGIGDASHVVGVQDGTVRTD